MLNLKDSSLFKQLAYIDGQWVGADSGVTFDVTNPATGELIATHMPPPCKWRIAAT